MGELMGGMMNKKKFSEEFTEYDKVVDGVKPDDHYETFEGRFETGGRTHFYQEMIVCTVSTNYQDERPKVFKPTDERTCL